MLQVSAILQMHHSYQLSLNFNTEHYHLNQQLKEYTVYLNFIADKAFELVKTTKHTTLNPLDDLTEMSDSIIKGYAANLTA